MGYRKSEVRASGYFHECSPYVDSELDDAFWQEAVAMQPAPESARTPQDEVDLSEEL